MKIGEFYFNYNESPNFSIIDKTSQIDKAPDNHIDNQIIIDDDNNNINQIIIDE